jgi:hypothetical protein
MVENKTKKTATQGFEESRLSNRELNPKAKMLIQRAEKVLNQIPRFKEVNFFSLKTGVDIFRIGEKKYEVISLNIPVPGDVLRSLTISEDDNAPAIHLFANTLDVDLSTIPGLSGTLGGSVEYAHSTAGEYRDSNGAVEKVSEYFNELDGLIKAQVKLASAK